MTVRALPRGRLLAGRSTVLATTLATAGLAISASLVALLTARWMGPLDRGLIVIVTTLATFLLLTSSLGLGTGLRVLTQGEAPLPLAFAIRIANYLAGIGLIVGAIAAVPFLALAGAGYRPMLVPFLALLASTQLLNYLQRELVHGLGRHSAALLGETAGNFFVGAVVVTLHAVGALSLPAVLMAMIVASIGQAFVLRSMLRAAAAVNRSDEKLRRVRDVVRECLPALTTSLGQALIQRGDRLIVGGIVGSAAVGIYGASATIADAMWLLPAALAQIVVRRVSVTGWVDTSSGLISWGLLGVTVLTTAVALLAHRILEVLVGTSYLSGTTSLQVLAVASIPMGCYQLLAAALNGYRSFKAVQSANVVGGVVMFAACGVLIPRIGMVGAAWASLLGYAAMAAVVTAHYLKVFGRKGAWHAEA